MSSSCRARVTASRTSSETPLDVAAFELGVVLDADPGQHRHLLAAQPGHASPAAVGAQAGLLRRDPGPAGRRGTRGSRSRQSEHERHASRYGPVDRRRERLAVPLSTVVSHVLAVDRHDECVTRSAPDDPVADPRGSRPPRSGGVAGGVGGGGARVLHRHVRRRGGQRRAAVDPDRSRRRDLRSAVGGRRLHVDVRRPAARRRSVQRPPRAHAGRSSSASSASSPRRRRAASPRVSARWSRPASCRAPRRR